MDSYEKMLVKDADGLWGKFRKLENRVHIINEDGDRISYSDMGVSIETSIRCAIIALEEIIKSLDEIGEESSYYECVKDKLESYLN